ncbi:MAG: outer membrane beta-barrel protein [Pseudorhodoplanes sp.]
MRSIQTSLIAGFAATAAMAAPASAADMPMVYKAPVVIEQAGGWYLRGDIGMTNQKVKSIDNALFDATVTVVDKSFDTGIFGGLGIGYTFNDWFRVDVTGEYRGKTAFRGLDVYPNSTNEYTGTKSEWLFLANAYVDLGTWWCLTPFVGAGIGYSRNTIDNFRDTGIANLATPTLAYGNSNTQWEMAWALHAGVAYKVNKAFTAEFAYRYTHLGDFQSGDLITYLGQNSVYNPMLLNNVSSHDFKLGLRWALNPGDNYAAPLAVSPGYSSAPVYSPPPPVYSPPAPLMRKG